MEIYGIDVSSHQGTIDWLRVALSGRAGFAILRCHQKYGIDEAFEANYQACRKYGIPVGAYKLSYAMTKAQAKAEAKKVVKALKGKELALPVFFDLEQAGGQESLEASKITSIAETFLAYVKSAGYRVGIYCNQDWYNRKISAGLKKKYDFWIASYPGDDRGEPVERVRPAHGVGWQYSERGRVNGITGNVDMDVFDVSILGGELPIAQPETAELHTGGHKEELPIAPPESAAEAEVAVINPGVTARDILDIARGFVGATQGSAAHRSIIDTYNSHLPLAQGYRVSYTDSWCDAFVSACFIKAGAEALIGGTECGVERHVGLFRKAGIWTEDGTIVPQAGDIIVFNWDQSSQPNDGFADHIGLVEAVGAGMVGTIEGNSSGAVRRRQYSIGDGSIRGYARPKYGGKAAEATQGSSGKTAAELAQEVIRGDWGNGQERIDRLTAAGYDAAAVQRAVNEALA